MLITNDEVDDDDEENAALTLNHGRLLSIIMYEFVLRYCYEIFVAKVCNLLKLIHSQLSLVYRICIAFGKIFLKTIPS